MPLDWRRRRLTSCGALVAMLIAAPALAQRPFDYDRLVDTYATGHLDEAVSQLSRWPSEQVRGAVDLFVKAFEAQTALVTAPLSSRRLRAAVMLHTDFAAAMLHDDFTRAESHINLARRLVELLAVRRRRDPGAREFVPRWYEFAPSMYVAHHSFDRALFLIQEGFNHAPDNATLHLYRGIVFEMAGPSQPALVARARSLALRPGRLETVLEVAARAYGLALKADRHMAVARIHLGRVHFLQHDSRARADLEQALADATDTGTRYLAHVFLGDLAESGKRPADALREYEAAIAIGPRYQTAYVAAARMADALGEFERAREIALALVGIEKREDPWWDYSLGALNMPALLWLRTAAQEP